MKASKRLWRTEDGNLVLDSDQGAVSLAYGEDDEIDKDDEAAAKKALGSSAESEESDVKQAAPAGNKKRAAANKSK